MPPKPKGKPKAATAAPRSSARATPASRKRQGSNVDQQPAKRTRRAANDNANAGAEEDEDPEEEEEEEIPEEEVVEPPAKGGRRGRVAKKAAPRRCGWARSARSRPILPFFSPSLHANGFYAGKRPSIVLERMPQRWPLPNSPSKPLFSLFFLYSSMILYITELKKCLWLVTRALRLQDAGRTALVHRRAMYLPPLSLLLHAQMC